MQLTFDNISRDPFQEAISPLREIAAYEALWNIYNINFKKIAELFAKNPGKRPSDLVDENQIKEFTEKVIRLIDHDKTNILINNTWDYPKKLRDAKEPVEILYFKGDPSLIQTRSIAVVGTRKPTAEGIRRTQKLVRHLVDDGFTIVSGLAAGVDSVAHKTAIEQNGKTIAVIGTPLNACYPKENKDLQDKIAQHFLLISQVPFHRYSQQGPHFNRLFFPERNKTMSALTEGTIIVEASDTSGTLIQARAAMDQQRKLFILDSCFKNPNLKWPQKFEAMGAIRVKEYEDISKALINSDVPTIEN